MQRLEKRRLSKPSQKLCHFAAANLKTKYGEAAVAFRLKEYTLGRVVIDELAFSRRQDPLTNGSIR